MEYRNVENWKTVMRKIAKLRNLDIQDVQQRYVLEEFAEKIGASKHADILILKGGFVVSTILGLDTRMTRDLDVTCRSTIYSIEKMKQIIQDIIDTNTHSFFEYSLIGIREAQDDDPYSGFIVQISAMQESTKIMLKIDISNNTLIFPEALRSSLDSLFTDKKMNIMIYTIENIIAEKYETTLDRGEFNTRMRDLFDVYMLMKENLHMIDEGILAETIIKVSKDRDTLDNLSEFEEIVDFLVNSEIFKKNFERYKSKQYPNLIITINDVFEQFKVINIIVERYFSSFNPNG